jgi:hypothetical protein
MASFPRPEVPNTYTTIRSLKWSSAEKVIARRAFERALQQDLEELMRGSSPHSALAANVAANPPESRSS